MKNIFVALILLLLAFSQQGTAQDSFANELGYEVNHVYPYISITKATLYEAVTLLDLNDRYQTSWIRDYVSVEISTIHQGKVKKTVGKNDVLSPEQKDNMKKADAGAEIAVRVEYMPENNLTHNDVQEIDFTFTVKPDVEAAFVGGEQALKKYLKEQAIDQIAEGSFKGYDLAAVQFTINEEGQVSNAQVFESVYHTYNNEAVHQLLLETLRKMPCWTPAEYANGVKVKQDFVWTVGNMENCVVNLLNIQRD